VIVALPSAVTVILLPTIFATVVLELVYMNAPSLFDVGGVIVKVCVPMVLSVIEKFVNVGGPRFTWRVVVIVPTKLFAVLA
jgi:predicted transcriptional regulator